MLYTVCGWMMRTKAPAKSARSGGTRKMSASAELIKPGTSSKTPAVMRYTLSRATSRPGVSAMRNTACCWLRNSHEPMALERMSRPRVAKKPICATTAISAISSATPHKPSRARNGMVFSWVKIRAKLYLA